MSVLLYFACVVPISVVHESGHYLICQAADHKASMHVSIRGMFTSCVPDLDTFGFYVAGPALATAVSIGIVFIGYSLRNKYNRFSVAILILGVAYTADQSSKIILEGMITQSYESGLFDAAITLFQMFSLVIPIAVFAKHDRLKPDSDIYEMCKYTRANRACGKTAYFRILDQDGKLTFYCKKHGKLAKDNINRFGYKDITFIPTGVRIVEN